VIELSPWGKDAVTLAWTIGAPLAALVVGWSRAAGVLRRLQSPTWRHWLSFGSLILASVALLIYAGSVVWARAVGGFSNDDPRLFLCLRTGFLISVGATLAGIVGKHPPRVIATLASAWMLILWWAAGIAE
jgi:hypothetical protein